ncbi:DUF3040 domain-containing protein [Streptomyces sp. NPDC007984]|uniref:DUF3040 domain-containing protein n=1 Tax=Streptomyces sp. NPDC007984 TaxID=3364801 RepID=UPI0036E86794
MKHLDDTLLRNLAQQMEQRDPPFAQPLDSGLPRRPRERGHGPAWTVLAVALAMLVTGMALPNGLLIAAGVVVAGVAGHLFDSDRGNALGRSFQRLHRPGTATGRSGSRRVSRHRRCTNSCAPPAFAAL